MFPLITLIFKKSFSRFRQYSDLMNYPNLDAFCGEADTSKNNVAGTYGNNGSITYGDNGATVCHELLRIDRPTENTFMEIPVLTKKE